MKEYSLNQTVMLLDRAGVGGRGRVIARSYCSPMLYDVIVDGEIISNVTAERLADE